MRSLNLEPAEGAIDAAEGVSIELALDPSGLFNPARRSGQGDSDCGCGRIATLIREGDELVMRLSTLEKLGGMRGDVRIPLDALQDVVVSEDPFASLRGFRAPGTGFPRLIALGTWRYKGRRDFAALYRGKAALIVHLHDAPYERLLVSADDANALASSIRAG